MMAERIGLLGCGRMGLPMGQRLLGAGFPLTVWNRTPQKAQPLLARGATWADSPAAAVAGANVVITMLTDGSAVDAVVFELGAAQAMAPGTVLLDMTSTSPRFARELAARLAPYGVACVDAPVSGGTRGAEAGALAIMAGGDPQVVAALAAVLAPLGTARRVGPVGAGQLSKLANQIIVAVTIGAVAEALLLAQRGGADPVAVRDALRGGFADSRILNEHGRRMLDRNFAPGGTVHNQIKDLDAASDAAADAGLHLPLLSAVRELFSSLRSNGGGDLDHSALLLEIERQSDQGSGMGNEG